MKIYNSLNQKKEEIKKNKEQKLFVCGPTVYDLSHIGHARTYLAFDIITKYLRSRGFEVNYVQNITDIDDKIIQKGKKKRVSPFDISNEFEEKYYEDMKALGIDSINEYVRSRDVIPEIIFQIESLIKNGFAYETTEGVYFKVREFKDYGKLSNQNIDDLRSGSRVEIDDTKEDPLDFVLWKFPKSKENIKEEGNGPVIVDGEPLWKSPWGWGRPGWHIEDTAISESKFGPQYDLHGGAEELKFPHHESEIAQQEAASGKKPFVRIWMHTGVLTVDGEKMGKSLGNFVTIRDFLKNHSPKILRWLIINNHYRSKVNYFEDVMEQPKQSLETLETFLAKLRFVAANDNNQETETVSDQIDQLEKQFHEAMEDDFNTPKATASIFTFIKNIQSKLWSLKKQDAQKSYITITNLIKSLGLDLSIPATPNEVQELLKERDKLRSNKQFIQADKLRNKLKTLGYEIEDTPLGSFAIKK